MKAEIHATKPTLTETQRSCLTPHDNLIVNAGAGSGKTFLLVKKIVGLLAGEWGSGPPLGIEDLFALTFTRKAAGEIRTRVYREILDRIDEQPGTPEAAHLSVLRSTFQAANISTIHGLASSLIRAHPIETATDPDFQSADEAVEARLSREAVRLVLRKRWSAGDRDLIRCADLMHPNRIRAVTEHLLRNPITLREVSETMRTIDLEALIADIQDDKRTVLEDLKTRPDGFNDSLTLMRDHCEMILRGEGKKTVSTKDKTKAQRLLDELIRPLEDLLDRDDYIGINGAFFDSLKERAKEIGRFRWQAPSAGSFIDDIRAAVIPWLEAPDRDLEALQIVEGLVSIAQEAADLYRREKDRQALLSHDDLILRGHRLAVSDGGPTLSSVLHILVDEFQDTDPLQWKMILELARQNSTKPASLFLVGDSKQAIYGFRGADHTVTQTARETLMQSSESGCRTVSLNENFRSLQAPLDFSNALFSEIFKNDEALPNPYEVPPQMLRSGRTTDEVEAADSSVTVLAVQEGDVESRLAEARAVVKLLGTIVAGEVPEYASVTELIEAGRPAVGMLFRAHSAMSPYISELTAAGLPFSVYHGRSFFDVPEIVTLRNLLEWLAQPEDDIALAGVLRSPLCSWTDEDLSMLCLRHGGRRTRLWHRLTAVSSDDSALPSGASVRLTRELLGHIRILASHLTLSETMRFALDHTAALLQIAKGPRRAQALANIEKFLAIVRKLESREGASPHSIAAAIREAADTDGGEAEAESPQEGAAVIQLMTIHAAKGLEFPMVVTASLGSSHSGGRSFDFAGRIVRQDSEDPSTFQRLTPAAVDFPDDSTGEAPRPTILKAFLREHADLQEAAEEKRLLYVALTRARDHILIPLVLKSEKNGIKPINARAGSHARLMLDAFPELETAIINGESHIQWKDASVRIVKTSAGKQAHRSVRPETVRSSLEAVASFQLPEPSHGPKIAGMTYPRHFRVSVSQMMAYKKCPRRFYIETYLPAPRYPGENRLPSTDENVVPVDEPVAVGSTAAIIGSAVHGVLERSETAIADWNGETSVPPEIADAVSAVLQRIISDPNQSIVTLQNIVLTHLQNLAKSRVLVKPPEGCGSQWTDVLREIPFELEQDGVIISGVIDRIARTDTGAVVLWDYKTNRTRDLQPEDIIRNNAYDLQLDIYCRAANRISGSRVSSAGILFTGGDDGHILHPVAVEADRVAERTDEMIEKIAASIDAPISAFPSVKPGTSCDGCPGADYGLC